MVQNPLRGLPSVNELVSAPPLKEVVDKVSHSVVVSAARRVLDDVRQQVRTATDVNVPTPNELVERISDWIQTNDRSTLVPVINGTGVLLHTGLGRAPLPASAVEEMRLMGQGYCSLEVEVKSGKRSQRNNAVEPLICELTGAEAAAVVNNNAAATLLTLSAIAHGKEVVVSRGHLVEIGGSFRLPDVMTTCGAVLREVGTTNKTRASDYEEAIGESTGALMLVHPSNYRVVGFTESATLQELVAIGRKHRLPVIDDIGSGALIDFGRFKLFDEPHAPTSVSQGADLVLFSGDKLVGGPQAGIICGKKAWVDRLKSHPMMRAMRVDKVTLAGLAATLRLYRDAQQASVEVPLLAMLETPIANLKMRAERLQQQIETLKVVASVESTAMAATLGGGTLPTQQIDSWGLKILPRDESLEQLSERLRVGAPSVFGRVQEDAYWIDLRAIPPGEDQSFLQAMESLGNPRHDKSSGD